MSIGAGIASAIARGLAPEVRGSGIMVLSLAYWDPAPRGTRISRRSSGIVRHPREAGRRTQALAPGRTMSRRGAPARASRRSGGINASRRVVRPVPVPAPFPDISVHVVQAERVGGPTADRLDRVPRVVLEPGVPRQQRRVVAEAVAVPTPGAAGVFPLGLGRQAVARSPRGRSRARRRSGNRAAGPPPR